MRTFVAMLWATALVLTTRAADTAAFGSYPTAGVRRTSARLSSSSNANNNDDETAAVSSYEGKTVYQRSFYRFPPEEENANDDFEHPKGMVIEERLRYQVLDPENQPDVVSPVGPRTLLLREANVEEGKIGDVFFTLHVPSSATDPGKAHAGRQASWQAAFATALYLCAAAPSTLLQGQVLQVAAGTDLGLATLLGCLGAAHLNQPPQNNGATVADAAAPAEADDILTVPPPVSTAILPKGLKQLTLTDGSDVFGLMDDTDDANGLDKLVAATLEAAGVPPSEGVVVVEAREWSRRVPPRLQTRHSQKEYNTIVVSDVSYTFPEAKELARTVAHSLEPSNPYYVTLDKQGQPVPRLVHVALDARETTSYLQRFLRDGFRMTVDAALFGVEVIHFVLQTVDTVPSLKDEEAALDPLALQVQDMKTVDYRVVTAQHHPDYSGGGSGEYFFPLETGQYDERSSSSSGGSSSGSRSTYLERDPRQGGGGGWLGQ